jgi:peptidoglycan/LPS O-acetylase OafA/YrhL
VTSSSPSAASREASAQTGGAERRSPWILDAEHNRRVVDGVRAIGIVLVVAFHGAFLFTKILPGPQLDAFIAGLPSVLNIVWQALGSEIVFFTSSFLLSYLLLREHGRYGSIDVRDFWIRRVSRIVPLFLVALAVYMIGRNLHWDRVLTNVLFVARIADYFDLTRHGGKNYIPVGWSLEVMMQVYLVLPFIVLGCLRTRLPLTAALGLAALSVVPRYLALAADPAAASAPFYQLVYRGEAPKLHEDLYYLTWFRLTPFLLGLVAAVVVTHHRTTLERWCASSARASATLVVGAALVVASGFLPLHDRGAFVYERFGPSEWVWFWTGQRPVLIIGVALVLLTALASRGGAPAIVGRALSWRVFAPISHGIYSIFLFHFACLIPAAAIVFLPAVVTAFTTAPTLEIKVLREHLGAAIGHASAWQYLAMVAIAVWLSTLVAGFLTRTVEAPVQAWLRKRYRRRDRELLPHAAGK